MEAQRRDDRARLEQSEPWHMWLIDEDACALARRNRAGGITVVLATLVARMRCSLPGAAGVKWPVNRRSGTSTLLDPRAGGNDHATELGERDAVIVQFLEQSQERLAPDAFQPVEKAFRGEVGPGRAGGWRYLRSTDLIRHSGDVVQVDDVPAVGSGRFPCPGASPRGLRRALDVVELLGDRGPVDDVPERVDLVGPPVLMLEVIGVLQDVDAVGYRLDRGDGLVAALGDDGL
jgi:hypothetical protein